MGWGKSGLTVGLEGRRELCLLTPGLLALLGDSWSGEQSRCQQTSISLCGFHLRNCSENLLLTLFGREGLPPEGHRDVTKHATPYCGQMRPTGLLSHMYSAQAGAGTAGQAGPWEPTLRHRWHRPGLWEAASVVLDKRTRGWDDPGRRGGCEWLL